MRDFTKLNLRNNKKKLKLYTDTHGGNKKSLEKQFSLVCIDGRRH